MSKWSRLRLAVLVAASTLPTLVWQAGCATVKIPLLLPGLPGFTLPDGWYQRVIQYVVIANIFD
ncbi:MAG: hypothetical protein GXY55_07740 [Phycisphaerae bacterium]|nr:hypothetical protein [Phycisphaerae bacterium]